MQLLSQEWAQAWQRLDLQHLDRSEAKWISATAVIVEKYRGASVALADSYTRSLGFAGAPPLDLDPTRLRVALHVTGPIAVKVAMRAGHGLSRAGEIGRSLSAGSASRMVLDAGRDVVRLGSVNEPTVRGWQRVGSGECDFCQMLIGRGDVYTESSADFESHDRCQCTAEPVFD